MKSFYLLLVLAFSATAGLTQTNTLPPSGNVGIGTTTPGSQLTIRGGGTGMSLQSMGSPYFGSLAFNRESLTGAIFDPNANAFQINNGPDLNLHVQVYNGLGVQIHPNALVVSGNAYVGIGTATPNSPLEVNGRIRAKEIKVEVANWPDYVFSRGYALPDLDTVESFIRANGHLPGIPSAAQVQRSGVDLGEMNALLLKKMEEMTLQMIEMKKQIRVLSSKIK